MRQRIITGLIGGSIVLLILISNPTVLSIAVGVISLYALHEMYCAIGINKNIMLYIASLLFAAVAVFVEKISINLVMPIVFIYVVIMFIILLAYHKTIKVADIALSLFMTVYIVYTMSHIVFVRNLPNGAFNIFLIFVGAFGTDTFAYFTGVFFGKHKLCPEISPKKTVEGAVGGMVGVVICFLVMGGIMQSFFSVRVHYVPLMILGVLCGAFSEIGDLAASVIKRQYNIKDYGNILPGHGGIMDRIDSIIFIAPLVYYFIKNIPVLG